MANDSISCLVEYVVQFGEQFWTDHQFCRAVLAAADDGTFSRREVNVLACSVMLAIPAQLKSDNEWQSIKRRLELAQLLHDELGLDQLLAQWSIDAWCTCLDLPVCEKRGPSSASQVMGDTTAAACGNPNLQRLRSAGKQIMVTLVQVRDGPLGSKVTVQVANDTALNFTEMSLEFAAYDKAGYMADTAISCKRSAPGADSSIFLDFDCVPSDLKKVVLLEFATHSTINGKYLSQSKVQIREAINATVLVASSEVTGISMESTVGLLGDIFEVADH